VLNIFFFLSRNELRVAIDNETSVQLQVCQLTNVTMFRFV